MPPVEIDGNHITGATIDGQDVQEITVDGQTVFTAVPPLPASAIHRYDPSQLSLSNNATVNTRTDSIGSDDLTGTGTFKTNELNGEPMIDYDGSSNAHSGTLSGTISQPYTIIGAFKNTNYGTSGRITFFANDDNKFQLRYDGAENDLDLFAGNPGVRASSSQLSPVILAAIVDSTGIIRENGTQIASGSLGGEDLTGADFNLGDRNDTRRYDGLMGDVIIYDANLDSSGEIQQEEQRLADKYGISI